MVCTLQIINLIVKQLLTEPKMNILFACLLLAAFTLTISASPVANKLDKDDVNALLKELAASQDDISENNSDDLSEILAGKVKQDLAKEIQANKKDAEKQGIFTSLLLGTVGSTLLKKFRFWKLKDKQALLQELIDMNQEEVKKMQDDGDAESQWWWTAAIPLAKKFLGWKEEQAILQEMLNKQDVLANTN